MKLAGKKVLVTGADGFIGSHLVEELVELGCQVRAMALYNSFNSWGWLDSLEKRIIDNLDVVLGDIRDPALTKKLVSNVDVVFHLAALIAIPYSYSAPVSYVETNIKGTLNILEATLQEKVERVVVTSTSEVYGTAKTVPICENHPLQGQSPYSASKIGSDQIAESFHCSYGLPVVIVRPFNTYGPRQSARAFIPTVITQLLDGSKEIKLGSLTPTRDLVYVRDTVRGFCKLAEVDSAIGEVINISTQKEYSVKTVAEKLIQIINPSAVIVSEQERKRPERSEVQRLLGSNTKLKELTGWCPDTQIHEGLNLTVEWFKRNKQIYKSDIYNI